MEAICSSETSVDTQRTTRRYILEDDTLHYHHCEYIKSYTVIICFVFTVKLGKRKLNNFNVFNDSSQPGVYLVCYPMDAGALSKGMHQLEIESG
jgi:hypothetical protein